MLMPEAIKKHGDHISITQVKGFLWKLGEWRALLVVVYLVVLSYCFFFFVSFCWVVLLLFFCFFFVSFCWVVGDKGVLL